MEQALKIVNSLLEASEMLRKLFPETYDERSKKVQAFIRQVMDANSLDVLPATIMCMEAAQEKGNEGQIHWFAAAAVDMLCGQKPHVSPRSQMLQMADLLKL